MAIVAKRPRPLITRPLSVGTCRVSVVIHGLAGRRADTPPAALTDRVRPEAADASPRITSRPRPLSASLARRIASIGVALNMVRPLVKTAVLARRQLPLLSRNASPGARQIRRPRSRLAAVLAAVRFLRESGALVSLRPLSDETACAAALISIAGPLVPRLSTAIVVAYEAIVVEIDGLVPPSNSPTPQLAEFGGQNCGTALQVGNAVPTGDGQRVLPMRRR